MDIIEVVAVTIITWLVGTIKLVEVAVVESLVASTDAAGVGVVLAAALLSGGSTAV